MNDIINEWDALDGQQQLDFCRNCVCKVAAREFGYENLCTHGTELDDYAHTVYIKLRENLTAEHVAKVNAERMQEGKQPITLKSMVYRAARTVLRTKINAYNRQDARDAGAPDTEQISVWDMADAVALKIDLQRFVARQDERNQKIIGMIRDGYTERQISAAFADQGVKLSNVAVHKRIAKMRGELLAEIA